MKIHMVAKTFFDSTEVLAATDSATRRVLSRFGAFVRTRAKTSMKKRKGISEPGEPPHKHVGFVSKFLFFGYDTQTKSVVVGPELINRHEGTLPLLEYGGSVRRGRKSKLATYRPRPFMGPALNEELPGLPAMWRDSIVSR